MGASNPMKHERETVPCETCGTPTPMLGTKRCDACWEVETRLVDYVRRGEAKAYMRILDAFRKAYPDRGDTWWLAQK